MMEKINTNAALLVIDMQQGINHPKLGSRWDYAWVFTSVKALNKLE